MANRFHGRMGKGFSRTNKEQKRLEAEIRNETHQESKKPAKFLLVEEVLVKEIGPILPVDVRSVEVVELPKADVKDPKIKKSDRKTKKPK